MSVVYGKGLNGHEYLDLEKNQKCFYCNKVLKAPAVRWVGESGWIHLHPNCVSNLYFRMMLDVDEIEGFK